MIHSLSLFFSNPVNIIITISSLIMSGTFFIMSLSKDASARAKVTFLFIHLLLLIFPLYYFGLQTNCQVPIFNCDVKTIATFIPIGLLAVFVTGFFAAPMLHLRLNKRNMLNDKHISKFMADHSKKQGIKVPKIYLLDTAKPMAYSMSNFVSAIFISAGMLDMLSKKELQAVLLHELSHIKSGSSLKKFSTLFVKMFSPMSSLASFGGQIDHEEKMADGFAVEIQQTSRFVNSAKKKIDSWNHYDETF